MAYELIIGDESFSSWSLRGWLMFERFDLPVKVSLAGLYSGTFHDDLASFDPARFVPAMRMPDGTVVGDTLAMAETLAELHPTAGLWPTDPSARARARWLVAEMHSGFGALREACPMNLRHVWDGFLPSEAVVSDLNRIQALWAGAKSDFGSDDSPWLFGAYSLADVFYAPVAARIAGYQLPVGSEAQAYVAAHLADPAFDAWRKSGLTRDYDTEPYQMDLPSRPWPE